ncbi:MAG: Methyltransferase type 11 [Gammaproteobacteria bacterium]|nr:Methyltransferase type 11 [Gammaproteobacteria bacterium]
MAESDWNAYWQNAGSASIHKDSGPQDEVLERFWLQFFRQYFSGIHASPVVLDLACGFGAVSRLMLATVQTAGSDSKPHLACIDASFAAVMEVRQRYPVLTGITANARLLPFKNESIDLVTSQFGIEYAGHEAFLEVARIVRPSGLVVMVLHLRDGGIYRECATNLKAINGFRNSSILPCFAEIFRVALAVQSGQDEAINFRHADSAFSVSVKAAEKVLQRWGKHVTDGLLFRLYSDIARMYQRFKLHDPDAVFAWTDRASRELESYSGRMSSMLDAALDDQQLKNLLEGLAARCFTIQKQEILAFGKVPVPAAWVVVAEKSAN